MILIMKIFVIILSSLFTSALASDQICENIKSKGEGHWPMSESAFTEEEAIKAMNKLNKYLTVGTNDIDSVSIDNQLLIIRGYLLKSRAIEEILFAKEEFCDFMYNDAHIQH